MSLQDLIIKNINSKSYNLTHVQIKWMNNYIKLCPDSFITITHKINDIISNGIIDIHDIPKIIILISDNYHNNTVKNDIECPDIIILFVKLTIDSIINSDLFSFPYFEKNILDSLINSSLDLLRMNITIVKKDFECWYIFKYLYLSL